MGRDQRGRHSPLILCKPPRDAEVPPSHQTCGHFKRRKAARTAFAFQELTHQNDDPDVIAHIAKSALAQDEVVRAYCAPLAHGPRLLGLLVRLAKNRLTTLIEGRPCRRY